MLANAQLSITMPTYNRADFLDYFLETHIPVVKKFNIPIYISDNASTDHTKDVVNKWKSHYVFLNYSCNKENLGMDKNFEISLNLPETEYIWMFGETYQLPSNGLEYILNLLGNGKHYDAFIFNLESKISVPMRDYNDQNLMLRDLSGLMSCVSCMVYSKEVIKAADFSRYYNTYFSLEAIIFEFIANKPFNVHWVKEMSVQNLHVKTIVKKNWSYGPKMLEIGVEGWIKFIYSLPASYTLESKFKAEKSFGRVSNLLSFKGLLSRRADGVLTLKGLMQYSKPFVISGGRFKFLFSMMICLIPVFIFNKLLMCKMKYFKK